jgi:DNA-binding transcriptional LysR family regulator
VNIHHLELFYHVARHGGISAATRKIPYGIQQPAVSGQILQLEKSLGQKLFQRRPFALTPAGRELFAFAEPFFGRVGEISRRLRADESARLRLAAPATILRGYLPDLLREHQRKYPTLSLRLHDANHAEAERLLQKHEIDLAITELEGKPAAGLGSAILFKLPLVLLLPRRLKVRSAAELWRGGAGTETLISLPPDEVMVRQFQSRLKKLGVHWPCGVEVSALDLIPIYVSLGFGVGLSIRIPRAKIAPGLRILPLSNFPPLVIAALWQKNLSRSNADFLDQIRRRARSIQPPG